MDERYGKDTEQQTSGDGCNVSTSALQSAQSYVAGGRSANGTLDESRKEFTASFTLLMEWGEANDFIKFEEEFDCFKRPPTGFGDEHEAWFVEHQNIWHKATYANRFGLGWENAKTARPDEYLTRLMLQNEFFGDQVELIALVNCSQKLRVLTRQPHVVGKNATYSEIEAWFLDLGFTRLTCNNRVAWYSIRENLLVADAHEGNVIKSSDGLLVPIDLNLVQPSGDMKTWVDQCIYSGQS